MQAKGDWVIVCRKSIPERIVGGIIIPNTNDEEFWEGIVVSIGEENEEDSKLSKGDYVLVAKSGSKPGTLVGSTKAGELFAVGYYDILCVVTDEEIDNDL